MFRREDELDAGYFGIQYLYKAGYRTDCFLNFMQTAWPQNQEPALKSFSAFPPLTERIEAVQEEIGKILPKRPGDIISTPQFAEFQAHLRVLPGPRSPKIEARHVWPCLRAAPREQLCILRPLFKIVRPPELAELQVSST